MEENYKSKRKKQVRFWLFGWNNYQKAQVVIKVPTESVDVNLETINGDVMIELSGIDLAASTVNGDVTISHSAFYSSKPFGSKWRDFCNR